MKSIKKDNERLISEDVMCVVWLEDESTHEKAIDPADFHFRFYVEHRTEEVICSREKGGAPLNCSIDNEGNITCYLPKNTFQPGRLLMEDMDTIACDGYEDGDFETIGRNDTEIIYIE